MSESKPLQIYKLENGKYRINMNEINSILDKVGDRNVAIYSINGPLRMGKSFMINFFLRYLMCNGSNEWINSPLVSNWDLNPQDKENRFKKIINFIFRGGAKRETTGIWMWSDPFIVKKSNREIALLIMDTQGTFDDQTTMQENAFIFSLSTLLSSFFIFNVQQQISEDKLQILQYFANYARLINEENHDEPFQKLLFLIRDWQSTDYEYGYYDDKHSIKGKNYKSFKLDPNPGSPMEVKFVREMILSSFDSIGCFLMPFPGREIARESRYDPMSKNADFLEFKEHLSNFVHLILSPENIVEKKIGGSSVTGFQMKIFVAKWAKIFGADQLQAVNAFYDATGETLKEIAKSGAIDNYNKRMKELMKVHYALPENEFLELHRRTLKECIDLFKSFKGFGNSTDEDIHKIEKQLNGQFEFYREINKKNHQWQCVNNEFTKECETLKEINKSNMEKMNQSKEPNVKEKTELLNKIENSAKLVTFVEKQYKEELENIRKQNYQIDHMSNVRSAESAGPSQRGAKNISQYSKPQLKAQKPSVQPKPSERMSIAKSSSGSKTIDEKAKQINENQNIELKIKDTIEMVNDIKEKYEKEIQNLRVQLSEAHDEVVNAQRQQKKNDAKRCVIQ